MIEFNSRNDMFCAFTSDITISINIFQDPNYHIVIVSYGDHKGCVVIRCYIHELSA